MAEILIIDDDELICRTLSRYMQSIGHNAYYRLTLTEGLRLTAAQDFDIIFLDVRLPDGNGLEALPQIRALKTTPEVIIITGKGDPDGAELAITSGAWTYIEKPPDLEDIALQVERSLQYRKEKAHGRETLVLKRPEIIGKSPAIETCLAHVAQVADSDASVLIMGETGTGKELFARALHNNSHRFENAFVVVDCTVLPKNLVESVLFGHEKGAFTGADKDRQGLIRQADNGTLFLDEIGELDLNVQKEFLRVLEERRLRPVGSTKEIDVDFRLVSATNRNIEGMVESGQFRRDLYYRIQSSIIALPSLKERLQDIKEIALHAMNSLCENQGLETKGFSADFFPTLCSYDWPGNVRELINVMEGVLAKARYEPTLYPKHLPAKIRIHQVRSAVGKGKEQKDISPDQDVAAQAFPKLQEVRDAALERIEKQYLHDLMVFTNRNIKEATRLSGLSQSHLYNLLRKYDMGRGGNR